MRSSKRPWCTDDERERSKIATRVRVVLQEVVSDMVERWTPEEAKKIHGGDDAVEQYREDPEASVFERFEVRVNNVGRVP